MLIKHNPGGNGEMDKTLVCSAGGPGSIPAVEVSNMHYSNAFYLGIRNKMEPDTMIYVI